MGKIPTSSDFFNSMNRLIPECRRDPKNVDRVFDHMKGEVV